MDDFMVGPQCEEMVEEEFVRGKRSLLELLDDAMPLSEDLAGILYNEAYNLSHYNGIQKED